MSRVAKRPVELPTGVEVKVDGGRVSAKGPKGELSMDLNQAVQVFQGF